MKIGDLVLLKDNYIDEPPGDLGLVLQVDPEFYGNQGARITIIWMDGEQSCEPGRVLRVINEDR